MLSSIFLGNQKLPDIETYTPFNLTLHTVEGGWLASEDYIPMEWSDDVIYQNFQENDSNITYSHRKLDQPFYFSKYIKNEHLNNSRDETNRNFTICYVNPHSYSDIIILYQASINYANCSKFILNWGEHSSSTTYTMPDCTYKSETSLSNLFFNETSVNVTMYENYELEDILRYFVSPETISTGVTYNETSVNLSLFPTITYSLFYYFIDYNSTTESLEIIDAFQFTYVKVRFEEFLIDNVLQIGYSIQIFRNRFVFWHTDWLPEGYNVPPVDNVIGKKRSIIYFAYFLIALSYSFSFFLLINLI